MSKTASKIQFDFLNAYDYSHNKDDCFQEQLNFCRSDFDRQKVFKKYYSFHEKEILKACTEGRWYDPYGLDFDKYFTPIERMAWNSIRGFGGVIVYPQYPVLNFFLDFGNPLLKIGLELDGKEFHNAAKDTRRDNILLKEGWKIFRITGSEAYKTVGDLPDETLSRDNYNIVKGEEFYNTIDGVIKSLYEVFFKRGGISDPLYYKECISNLNNHTLADFRL